MKEIRDADGRPRIRLETWGEIAQHLGVEVRTAQRWEGRMGLPVRRLDGSQAVFAIADELDAWRDSREKRTTPSAQAPALEARLAPAAGVPLESTKSSRRWWVWAVAASGLAIAIALGARLVPHLTAAPNPVTLTIDGTKLVALDAAGTPAWTHDFGEPALPINASYRPELRPWWQRVDADGDGVDEIVAIVGHSRGEMPARDVLYCFTLSGRLRYRYEPGLSLSFRQATFSPPWVFFDFESVPSDRSLWVSLGNSPWWPAAVVSLDGSGHPSVRYTQPGVVGVLRTFASPQGPRVLAAGVSNEYRAASIALLDPQQPPASAPAKGEGPYTCADCPTGPPIKYLLLPPSPLNQADGAPYNRIDNIAVRDQIVATTYEAEGGAGVVYLLGPDLELRSVTPTDSYWSWRPANGATWAGREGHPSTGSATTVTAHGVEQTPFTFTLRAEKGHLR